MKNEVQFLVCEGLSHSFSNILSTDAKDVQKLLRLSAAGNTGHGQTRHNNTRLTSHCRQHRFTKTTWTKEVRRNECIKVLLAFLLNDNKANNDDAPLFKLFFKTKPI